MEANIFVWYWNKKIFKPFPWWQDSNHIYSFLMSKYFKNWWLAYDKLIFLYYSVVSSIENTNGNRSFREENKTMSQIV